MSPLEKLQEAKAVVGGTMRFRPVEPPTLVLDIDGAEAFLDWHPRHHQYRLTLSSTGEVYGFTDPEEILRYYRVRGIKPPG